MSETPVNRRDVLKYFGASYVGIAGSTVPTAAANDRKKTPGVTHTLPYDLKVRNAGVEPVRVVVQFHGDSNGPSPVAQYESSTLGQVSSSEEASIDVDRGSYTVRVRANFNGSQTVSAERKISVPDSGMPDYAGILVSVLGVEEVLVSEVNV